MFTNVTLLNSFDGPTDKGPWYVERVEYSIPFHRHCKILAALKSTYGEPDTPSSEPEIDISPTSSEYSQYGSSVQVDETGQFDTTWDTWRRDGFTVILSEGSYTSTLGYDSFGASLTFKARAPDP